MLTTLPALLALAFVALPQLTAGLSYPICDRIGEEFITAGSRLEGDWPYYNLLFTCSGNLNLEGYMVDSCVLKGEKCGQAAADAFCQYLGFDFNSAGLYTTTPATSPALSMTGEWCVAPGQYKDLGHPNRTQFESIVAANQGPYCTALSSVTCIKTRTSLSREVPDILRNAQLSPAPAPANSVVPGLTTSILVNPSTISAGRRMKEVSLS